ncbi:MAG TPA: 3-deoxy-7-phosphoheptulonate synthase [Chlamydiales bacterium]|nr:3-deoxy-7-phosphoheptulonate synthase [Chlamydiales bacterium]
MSLLPSPEELKIQFPSNDFPRAARSIAKQILQGKDKRLVVIVGPCSIHDPKSALEYAKKLQSLSAQLNHSLFLIMRVFIEKPRSKTGWKGLIYDPYLDESNDLKAGLSIARKLLVQLTELSIPIAVELLEPLASSYFDDLITWGIIGARTCSSQPHRQMASRLHFPIGFKNDLFGRIEPAIHGVFASQKPHSSMGINAAGRVCQIHSQGNPLTHLILRGSENGSNYDPSFVSLALGEIKKYSLNPKLMIDCSHGNSGKNLNRQKAAFLSVIEQAEYQEGIVGVMLESHLVGGKQPHDPGSLSYGLSITDPCLSWEETAALLELAGTKRSPASPISMSFVQN